MQPQSRDDRRPCDGAAPGETHRSPGAGASRRALAKLHRDEAGQGLSEYAVMIGVIAGLVVLALIFMVEKIKGVLELLDQWL
jgi:Flp pilus assembly pilin Flp